MSEVDTNIYHQIKTGFDSILPTALTTFYFGYAIL